MFHSLGLTFKLKGDLRSNMSEFSVTIFCIPVYSLPSKVSPSQGKGKWPTLHLLYFSHCYTALLSRNSGCMIHFLINFTKNIR